MKLLVQSTARNLMVFLVDSADHVSGKTGATLTITESKDGAAFASTSPTVTERGNGWYSIALSTTNTNTLSDYALHITATGADPIDMTAQVVAINVADAVRAGLTSLPNAAAEAAGGLYTRGSGAGQLGQTVNGTVNTNPTHWTGTAVAAPTTAGVPRVDVKAMEAGVVTAAAVATNAIDADALATDAVTEIQSGLATSANQTTILARLPAALVGGRMDSSIGAITDGVITAAKFAADAITSTVLATSAAQKVRDSLLDYTLRTGRTVRGHLRRMEALFFSKVIGMRGATVTAYQPDGTTIEFQAVQDIAAGTRQAASTTPSETP